MKINLKNLCSSVLAAAVTFSAGHAFASNVAASEDFEGNFNSKGICEGWADNSSWAPVVVKYERETANPHSGKFAQKIICSKFGGGGVQFVCSKPVSLEKGKIYRFGFWVRGLTASGSVELNIRKIDAPWNTIVSQTFQIKNEWQYIELLQESPKTDASCWLMVRFSALGEIVLDDMKFEEVDISSLTKKLAGRSGNLVDNSSFELGGTGWGCRVATTNYFHGHDMVQHQRNYTFSPDAAYEGKGGFQLKLPEFSAAYLSSRYLELNPTHEYTISCMARTSRGNATVAMGVAGGEGSGNKTITQPVKIGKEWRRVQVTVKAPMVEKMLMCVRIFFDQPGIYDIDNVQIEQGNKVTDFKVANGSDCGITGIPDCGYINQGGQLPVNLIRYAASSADLAANELTVQALDFSEKTIFNKKFLMAQGQKTAAFVLPTEYAGVFRVEITDNKNDLLSQYIYAVIPSGMDEFKPGKPSQSFFGTHLGQITNEALDFAWLTGSRWLRLHPPLATKWMLIENEKGKFVWHDEFMKKIKDKGFGIVGSLDTTAVWASQHPELGFGWTGNKATSFPAKDIKDWENYVRQTVSHYKGIIDYWEVWNEPDASGFLKVDKEENRAAEYVRLLSAAYRVAHEVNPNVKVIGGVGTNIPTFIWSKRIADKGGIKALDILSFHWYSSLPNITEAFFKDVNMMRKLGANKKTPMPLWNTESGIFTPVTFYREDGEEARDPFGVQSQAAWVTLSYVGNMAAGVEKMFLYTSSAAGQPTRIECSVLREWDGAWRPAAVAALVTAKLLDGAKLQEAPNLADNIQKAVFTKDGYLIACVWKSYDTVGTNTVYTVPAGVKLVDIMGNVTKVKKAQKITLGTLPVWIITDESN
ncbi:MAG: carbohydrate binding domain-containing protein [Victivallaceae bacterium]